MAAPHELPGASREAMTIGAEAPIAGRDAPRALYARWERQHWSAEAVSLEADRERWARLSPTRRKQVDETLRRFFIGEYTAVDHMTALSAGAPDGESLLYLATQGADETQHYRFVERAACELLDLPPASIEDMLAASWERATPGLRELTLLEAAYARGVCAHPSDYAAWLRLVTVFHLVTEGVLAFQAQRAMIRAVRREGLRGLEAGFLAMTRDEGRHVAFGLHALRQGVAEGYADDISEVLERAVPALVTINLDGIARGVAAQMARATGEQLLESLANRASGLGLGERFCAHVLQIGRATLETARREPVG
jgi:ribonucleoside-diphosphate reductase beta chain